MEEKELKEKIKKNEQKKELKKFLDMQIEEKKRKKFFSKNQIMNKHVYGIWIVKDIMKTQNNR